MTILIYNDILYDSIEDNMVKADNVEIKFLHYKGFSWNIY